MSRAAPQPAVDDEAKDRINLLLALSGRRPIGVSRHFEMMLIHDKFRRVSGRDTPTHVLWHRLTELFDLDALDRREQACFDEIPSQDFELPPSEFGDLVALRMPQLLVQIDGNDGCQNEQQQQQNGRRTSLRLATKKAVSVPNRIPSCCDCSSKTSRRSSKNDAIKRLDLAPASDNVKLTIGRRGRPRKQISKNPPQVKHLRRTPRTTSHPSPNPGNGTTEKYFKMPGEPVKRPGRRAAPGIRSSQRKLYDSQIRRQNVFAVTRRSQRIRKVRIF